MTAEEQRLEQSRTRTAHWKRWGPYVSDRAWGTVREDYSAEGNAWEYFPHEHARSRAYRWNEDGLAGICDRHQNLCFAIALWNGKDSILKERLFGLTGTQGNHGEDCKECYYYLDSTPTHSYMKMLYKYPQAAFPYERLIEENRRRGKQDPEFELVDTGIFDESRYWDVFVEYAKATPEDILIAITVHNRGPDAAELHLLPTLWFRNRWAWDPERVMPALRLDASDRIEAQTIRYGRRWLVFDGHPEVLFTENETNTERLFGAANITPYVKDGINDYVVHGRREAVNPDRVGTKCSPYYRLAIPAHGSARIRLRLSDDAGGMDGFEEVFADRKREAGEFYATVIPESLSAESKNVMRQAFAGLMWSKQFYHYVVRSWLNGDPDHPPPPASRKTGRNSDWHHLYNADVISMPDKWEYPWYAAWDLAFHCLPIALIDSEFAKEQLLLMVREWYMHPNGQIPAYEWNFGDVNPPVHAWATLRVYKIEEKRRGKGDLDFLEKIFHKLLLNFTWWVNRKDAQGRNVFQGGFLGLDNIGVFDRSAPLPTGGYIEQADGTGWMAMYTLSLGAIALELAKSDPVYEDVASKFWEHFLYIAHAINHLGRHGDADSTMWDDVDGFFYDVLHLPDGDHVQLKIRSMVGLIPLFATGILEPRFVRRYPGFERRMKWFIEHRPDLTRNVASMEAPGMGERILLSVVKGEQLRRVLRFMLDENEFLSPYGIRALSKRHEKHPYVFHANGSAHRVSYEPAESTTELFGGNSNWRGPIWFPVNFLLIEALQRYHHYFGDEFKVECPTGSGNYMNLWDVAAEISRRLNRIFLPGPGGRRPVHGAQTRYAQDPHWKDLILFYEYFHGDNGAGIGASHQTGWSALVAKVIQQNGE